MKPHFQNLAVTPNSLLLTFLGILLFIMAGLSGCSTPYDENRGSLSEKPDIPDHLSGRDLYRLQPYFQNPWYWQYKGKPVLLLGASDEDNLFNHPNIEPDGLEAHLDELVSVYSDELTSVLPYVRNTLSSRDGGNMWWFQKDDDTGLFDLNNLNEEYWERFDNLLKLTAQRKIMVQIELWDRFDFARDAWDANPFNPSNNRNYNSDESGLPTSISSHPGDGKNPFFRTVPELEDRELLLPYQEKIVEKMMEISLKYDHVLYTISNETSESPLWSEYWARFLRKNADLAGKQIEMTEMWDAWDLTDKEHGYTFSQPELYSFVDISQNGHQDGQTHWDNMQKARDLLSVKPRPMNTVKIYGADNGKYHGTSEEEATNRLWRNIFGGLASSRFHRPPHGIGLNETAITHLRSASMLVGEFNIFSSEPSNELLNDCQENEAYAMAGTDNQYAVYFPSGGSVVLEVPENTGSLTIRWLNIHESKWEKEITREPGSSGIKLTAPDSGQWAVTVQVVD
ncbi:MAG: hypothetical protein WD267_02265 [Balneolales bacterium]